MNNIIAKGIKITQQRNVNKKKKYEKNSKTLETNLLGWFVLLLSF